MLPTGRICEQRENAAGEHAHQTPNEFVVKLDHVLRDQTVFRLLDLRSQARTLDDAAACSNRNHDRRAASNARSEIHAQQFRLSEAHTFTPNLLNVVNFTDAYDDNGSIPTTRETE